MKLMLAWMELSSLQRGIREDSREEVYFTHSFNIMKIVLNGDKSLIYKTWEATFNKILQNPVSGKVWKTPIKYQNSF